MNNYYSFFLFVHKFDFILYFLYKQQYLITLFFIHFISEHCYFTYFTMTYTIRFTPDFIKSCEDLWRDGLTKGQNGGDDLPDFKSFFEKNTIKEEFSYEQMQSSPFNPSKCEARVEKHGYAIQCTRSPFEGGCLCKTHQNMFIKFSEEEINAGKDIPYGRFNKPRPEKTLDKGNPIKWGPKQPRNKSQKNTNTVPKLKVGEMRDYLSSRVPNTLFKDLKKRELTELYLKEKEKENSSPKSTSSEDAVTTISETPGEQSSGEQTSEEKPPEEQSSEEQSSEEKPPEEKPPEENSSGDQSSGEQPSEEKQPVSEEQVIQKDDGAGVGLHLEISQPQTIVQYKTLFKELGIDTENFKGKRQYKQAYDDYLKKQQEENDDEKTNPMSDEEDDNLQEDKNSYEETTFEGVSYLEDEETGKIYNLKHQHVGKWNTDVDDIIWVSEEFKTQHDNSRP